MQILPQRREHVVLAAVRTKDAHSTASSSVWKRAGIVIDTALARREHMVEPKRYTLQRRKTVIPAIQKGPAVLTVDDAWTTAKVVY